MRHLTAGNFELVVHVAGAGDFQSFVRNRRFLVFRFDWTAQDHVASSRHYFDVFLPWSKVTYLPSTRAGSFL
jgi:hypothetical protein